MKPSLRRKEMIFQMIIRKIDKPTKEKKNKVKNYEEKEEKTSKHLENTYNLVGDMKHNDIKVMEVIREKRNQIKDFERE